MAERIKALSLKNTHSIAAVAVLLAALALTVLWGVAAPAVAGPLANAGLPQLVTVGATVRLDGSLSTNSSGSPLAYLWTFISVPDGSAANLSDPTAVNPTFTADQPGSYLAQLAVSDGTSVSTSQVAISTQSTPPVADAGVNQFVTAGTVVHLDGSRSSDAEGDALSFQWTLASQPAGSRSSIASPASIAPTFLADVAGTYVAQLTVSDSHGNQSTATVTVSTQDVPPIARAGRAQSVGVGTNVQLDGSATSDPGGDALSYSWSILSQPAGSTAALTSAASVNPTFVADVAGAYVAQLAVSDSHGNVSFSTVEVTTDAIPPIANAGAAQTIAPASTVQLDGSQSAANNGAPLEYRWNLLAKPAGSTASLSGGGLSSTSSFIADRAGEYLVQLLVSDGALTSAPSTVLITAAAAGTKLVISPSPVKFGAQAPGTTSTPAGVTITNLGTASVRLTSFLVTGVNASEFAVHGLNPVTMAPDTAFIFSVMFTPQVLGTRSATLIIYDNTGGPPRVVSLSGVGGTSIPGIQITPNPTTFPDQLVGTESAVQLLTVTNPGTAPLQISGLSFGGSNPGDFAFPATFTPPTLASPINVAANGATTIPVIFKPTGSGLRTATLVTADNVTGNLPSVLSGNGLLGPPLVVTPASIVFPDQSVGTISDPLPVTVTNPGAASLQVTALTFGGANAADFSTTSTAPITVVGGGGTVVIPVTFKPGATLLRSGNLKITDNSGGSAQTVTLSGAGTPGAGPGISLTPSPLDFSNQALNTTTTRQLTVTNTGATTVKVTSMLLAGANAGDFGINGPRSFTLTTGAVGSINVLFTPHALGSRTASLIIYDDTPTSPHIVTLNGKGGNSLPGIELTPNPLSFPEQSVSTTSTALSVTARNTGSATLLITGVSIGGANPGDFAFPPTFTPPTSASPINVAANATALIPVIFKPTAAGPRQATLIIADNASGSPHSVTLNGTGVSGQLPQIRVTPTAILFQPDQTVGTSSAASLVTVTNAGTTPVQITALAFGGVHAADFSTTATAPIAVAANNGTVTIPVIFTPGAAGDRTGALTVTDNSGGATHAVALSGKGIVPPPGISVSPSPLLFGEQGLNTTATRQLTVTNTGGTTAKVTGLLLSGPNAGDFGINGLRSFTVTAGGTGTINIQFTPQALASRTAYLIVYDDTGGSLKSVTITGIGVPPTPNFVASPTPLPFDPQLVGSSSAPISITVTNPGTAPLLITALSFIGINPGDFGFPAGFRLPTVAAPITVANNSGTTTIPVIFKPTASGERQASLQFADNATGAPHSVLLTGTGTAPIAVLSPSSVSFVGQDVNTASNPSLVTITNTGTAALQITGVTLGGVNPGDFTFAANFTPPTPASPITVAPGGGTATVPVVFKPTTNGLRSATLSITDNAASSPHTANLSGIGNGPKLVFNPASVSFGNQLQNQASAAVPFSIGNTGNADLVITGISIIGANAADFSFPADFTPPTPAAPITVPPNGVANLSVIFTPATMGARNAAVSVASNTPDGPQNLPLSGTGTGPIANLSATTINFLNQGKDTTSTPKTVTLTNKGTAPLTVSSFSITGANATDFATTATAPLTLPPNGSTNISVTFTPSALDLRSAVLEIHDNAIPSPQQVSLSGTGIGVPIFAVDPPRLDFPDQQGTQQTSAMLLTISNTGSADLVITTMSILGTNASDFSYGIVGGGGTGFGDFPDTVPPGGTLGVNVYFTASAAGRRTAVLIITDNAAGNPHQVQVAGNAILTPPTDTPSPASLSFVAQQVNTTSPAQSITVTNTGQTDLNVSGVSITGANASDFHVTPAGPFTVSKNGGTATLSVTFTPSGMNTRTATLKLNDNAPNGGSSVPLEGIGRGQGQISLPPISVGGDLQTLATASLDVAPSTALPVTITSSDPTKVLLVAVASDPNGASQGTAQITGTVPAGQGRLGFGFPGFWVQALASSGTAQITITAPGYIAASATVTLTPSGFVLNGPAGMGANFSAILGANSSLTVSAVQLDSARNILSSSQRLRGGLLANVTVNSGTPATGIIAGNPAVVQPGTSTSNPVTFQTRAAGTSLLSINQPAGYSAPATGTQLTATVSAPSISLNPVTVGYNQQALAVGQLNLAAATAMSVTVISSNPSQVLLSTNPAAVGTGSISLPLAAGATSLPTFYIQALSSSGVVTLTASAAGYANGTGNVALNPSAFLLSGPNGTANFSTTTISPPTNLAVTLWQLDPSMHPLIQGVLRPGASESVAVISGTPSTGTITGSPAQFVAGNSTNTNLAFQPAQSCTTPCTSALRVTQPVGFSTPASGGQLTVTVNQPSLTLRMIETTIGGNLEVPAAGALDAPSPSNLPVTIISNSPNVLLSTSPGALGTDSITVTVPTGAGVNSIGFPTYYVQALSNSGTAQLTASAPGFRPGTITVSLAPAGFVLIGPNGVGADFGILRSAGSVNLTVSAVVLDPATLVPTPILQQVRGGMTAAVTVVSDSAAAVVSGSPVMVPAGSASGVVTLQLQTTGVANISVVTPAGFTMPVSGAQLSATIN